MTTELFSGITASLPGVGIVSPLIPGEAAHPPQATKLSKSERAARCNQILRPLTLWVSQLHTLKIGILAAAGFVIFKTNDKNQQLTETFREGDKSKLATEALGNL